MNQNYQFYCLSFNNPKRKTEMTNRFETIGIDCKFYKGVYFTDDRLINSNISDGDKRVWSYTYGHLDMIQDFYYNTDKEHGIFCEDDIYIHKNLKTVLLKIILDFKILNLDVLLLGYLMPFKIRADSEGFSTKHTVHPSASYTYHNFPDNVWGAQMYMLSRTHAKRLIDKYATHYADKTIENKALTPFSSDWIFTKEGNRALISPMLAVEDGKSKYADQGQQAFHDNCHNAHFVPELFII